MDQQDLTERLNYAFATFFRIIMFAMFGLIFAYALDLDPITSYKVIVGLGIVGTLVGIFDSIERLWRGK